jgi:predicted short-subunit dehydrogenase-like oxidoreductase (DUF2520 family)
VSTTASDRIFILGAGRAGRSLASALRAAGVEVVGLHGRRAAAASGDGIAVSAGTFPESLARASVVLVTVRDAQLDEALASLAGADLAPEVVVLHASGSSDPAQLSALRASGHAAGTFHPLVPLADPALGASLLRGAWIGIDGDELARQVAGRLAGCLHARALEIPAGEKARYHAAAVFASNFPTVMAAVASSLFERSGIPVEVARDVVGRLASAAVENVRAAPPERALTGPVVRGDAASIARHVAALGDDPLALALYVAASREALAIATNANAIDAEAAARIASALGRADG